MAIETWSQHRVVCDTQNCGVTTPRFDSTQEAMQWAKKNGWAWSPTVVMGVHGTVRRCPLHSAKADGGGDEHE